MPDLAPALRALKGAVEATLLALSPALAQDDVGPPPVVAYTITDGREIIDPLSPLPGDARRGQRLFQAVGCQTCHAAAPPGGDLGASEIRLWIVAPKVLAPETAMPAYYASGQRRGAADPLHGGPRLTAEQIEHLVAYLAAAD
ncbi:MAG: c-type cytochrome [Pseudomonadota bacterium]